MITQERAREILQKAKELAVCGPWSDYLKEAMSIDEHEMVLRHWNVLPGSTSYTDSFLDFLQGTTGELG